MSFSKRARQLAFSRGLERSPGSCWSGGLTWTHTVERVDRALLHGERVVRDFTIVDCRWPENPDIAEVRERVTLDPDERGVVYAWDGRVIGDARAASRKGGVVLSFAWPPDLPGRRPEASVSASS